MPAKKILLVDDEEELLMAMKIRLASWGYDVITATSGEEAVRIAKTNRKLFDAIVLDIMMPGIDGVFALRLIRGFDKTTPIFMLTAYSSEKNIKEATTLGISGFIPKGSRFVDASKALQAGLRGAKKIIKVKSIRKKRSEAN